MSCRSIEDQSFQSIDMREIGLGPDGPVYGYWTITLEAGTDQESDRGVFRWQYSDFGETGTYECDELSLVGHASGRDVTGSYDPATEILDWDQLDYRRDPGR